MKHNATVEIHPYFQNLYKPAEAQIKIPFFDRLWCFYMTWRLPYGMVLYK